MAKKYQIFIEDENGWRMWANGLLDSREEVYAIRNILSKVGLSVYDSEREVKEN